MTRNDTPDEPAARRPISPAVFDHLFEVGIDRGNALDVDEPKLSRPISPAVFDHLFEVGIDRGNALDVDEPKLSRPKPEPTESAKSKD